MKQTAKIRKFKNKKLETVEEVRGALIAISSKTLNPVTQPSLMATPIKKEIQILMRKLRAQMKSAKPKNKPALKSFFGK
jgi:hypothetical protein